MSPHPQQERSWADVAALDRMRAELEELTARDARRQRTPAPSRPPRLRIGLALAGVLAVVAIGLSVVAGGEDEAVADLRDAPAALLEAGRYAFTTQVVVVRADGVRLPTAQEGTVDLDAGRARSTTAAGTSVRERLVTRDETLTRVVAGRGAGDGWARVSGARRAEAEAFPISLSSVQTLRDAVGERVAEDEDVDGIATTRYRAAMDAADFAGLAGSDGAALRGLRGTVEVWLDGDDLPRRLRARFSEGTRSYTVDTRYAQYGRTADIALPAPGDVTSQVAAADGDPLVVNLRALFER